MTSQYDIIIIGAGCAGLSLLVRIVNDEKLSSKKILLLDKTFKNQNDRTWCFWEKKEGYFENIVYHQWNNLEVKHPAGELTLNASPYRYKMIRGLDFYKRCLGIIEKAPNVTIVYDAVDTIDAEQGVVTCGERRFQATYLFSSILLQPPVLGKNDFYLLQHFMGWFIETDTDCFDPQTAQLMNFNVSQQQGCTFVYVLPVSRRKALIEYTLFSEEELPEKEYQQGLQQFITTQLGIQQYKIAEVENGVIPMTNLLFPQQEGRLFYIGTAGGQTKASTGYTFQFIQKQSAAIVEKLAAKEIPSVSAPPQRFNFYDSVLLRVLHERKMPGADVFYQIFQRNKASKVFRFLDNETNLWEELQIMNSARKKVFIPAVMQELQYTVCKKLLNCYRMGSV